MTRWLLVLVTLAILSFANTRRAEACGGGGGFGDGLAAVIIVGGATYGAATIGFGVADLVGKDHGPTYGLAEALIHTPIAIGFGSAFVNDLRSDNPDGRVALGAFTALHTALAIHGVYTLVTASAREERAKVGRHAARRPPRARTALGPAMIPNGAGIGYGGTF